MNEQIYPLTLYFDSSCPLCSTEMGELKRRDAQGMLIFADIFAPGFTCPLPGVQQQDLLRLMHARRADGQVVTGVEAFRLAYAGIGVHWVDFVTRLPLLKQLAEWGYPVLARNRYKLPGKLGRLAFLPMDWLGRCSSNRLSQPLQSWMQQCMQSAAARRSAKARCSEAGCELPPRQPKD